MNTSLVDSYAACSDVARRATSNFYASFFLLSREKRRAMEALYAFLRITDDLGDNHRPAAARSADLVTWQHAFQGALTGSQSVSPEPRFQNWSRLLPAVVDTLRRFSIPPEYLLEAIAGVEMDVAGQRYATVGEFEEYAYRVASTVGLACIHVWGFQDRAALRPARQCGLAFQLTNVLRDLKEDAQAGRVYLPEEDFKACCYTPDELAVGVCDERFRRLIHLELDRAENWYREGALLERYLYPDGRRVFGAMYSTYYRLLEEIRRRDGDLFGTPVRLSRWQRGKIVARWLLPRPTLPAARIYTQKSSACSRAGTP